MAWALAWVRGVAVVGGAWVATPVGQWGSGVGGGGCLGGDAGGAVVGVALEGLDAAQGEHLRDRHAGYNIINYKLTIIKITALHCKSCDTAQGEHLRDREQGPK